MIRLSLFIRLDVFASRSIIVIKLFLVIHPKDENYIFKDILQVFCKENAIFVYGGNERQYSVYNGLKAADRDGIILVHDGARPLFNKKRLDV